MEILLSEAEVKKSCEDYLTLQQNLGNLWYCRLNAGDFIETRGNTRRRIKGAGAGTSDMVVFLPNRVVFVELKSSIGKQYPDQIAFEARVNALGYRYYLVRSVDELIEVLTLC